MRYLLTISLLFILEFAHANCPTDKTVPNEYIVKIDKTTKASQKLTSFGSIEIIKKLATFEDSSIGSGSPFDSNFSNSKLTNRKKYETLLIASDTEEDIEKGLKPTSYQKNCYVETLGMDSSKENRFLSNDPLFFHQKWYLDSIASDVTLDFEQKREVIVSVTDTGVDVQHKDLKNNIWINEAELNGLSGVDDDGNGYVDDIYGYDVADNDNDPIPSTSDYYLDYDHGTHVSGLIGAETDNGFGIRGVSFNRVKIMAVKGFRSKEKTKLSDLIESIYYSVNNGAHIINASWGVDKEPEQAEIDAVNYALNKGVLIIAAAGNTGDPASWVTPGSIKGVITVSSINSRDDLSIFSNYGNAVDFVAPGGDGQEGLNEYLFSSALDDYFIDLRGTSMAAPLVTGALGLLLSQRGDINSFQALRALHETAGSLELESSNGKDKRLYKKINVSESLLYLKERSKITPLDPRIMSLENINPDILESKSLSSTSFKNSSGCSKHHSKRATLPSALLSLFFLILPSLLLVKKRKKLSA